jgi:AraC-like DNA-binding protein
MAIAPSVEKWRRQAAMLQGPDVIVKGDFGRVCLNMTGREIAPHVHPQYNMLIKLGGSDAEFLTDGESHILGDGDAIIFNRWQTHRKKRNRNGPTRFLSLLIEPAWLVSIGLSDAFESEHLFRKKTLHLAAETAAQSVRLAEIVRSTALRNESPVEQGLAEFLRIAMPEIIGRRSISKREYCGIDARITRAVFIINSRAKQNPSLSDVAREVGLSRSHFFGQFKKCVGVSSQHYLDAVRLGIAERVLIESVGSLNEVATDLGFSEQTHFARFFVLHTGITPGNYRRRSLILHNTISVGRN